MNFKFNPFSGLHPEEIPLVLVPRIDMPALIENLQVGERQIIQIMGKMGRGKTTHLLYLQQQLPVYPLVQLRPKEEQNLRELNALNEPIAFLDNIHFLSFFQRISLYRRIQTLVFTSHSNRIWELKLAGRKKVKTFRLEGIHQEQLREIIDKRLRLASFAPHSTTTQNDKLATQMIDLYDDDYRGIMNHLFNEFQQKMS